MQSAEEECTEEQSAVNTGLQEWESVGIALHQTGERAGALQTSTSDPNGEVGHQEVGHRTQQGCDSHLNGAIAPDAETDEGQGTDQQVIDPLALIETTDRSDAIEVQDVIDQIGQEQGKQGQCKGQLAILQYRSTKKSHRDVRGETPYTVGHSTI